MENSEKTLIVVAFIGAETHEKHITFRENFEMKDLSETYDRHGQLSGEEEGCAVKVYNFWNGNNWQSIGLDEQEFLPSVTRIDEEEEKTILEAYAEAEFPAEHERGIRVAKVGDYEFRQSPFASDPWIATITE